MLIRNLSLLSVLLLPFLLRQEVLSTSLYFSGSANPAVENTVERREGIFHQERVWYSVAVRDLSSMQFLSAPAQCSDPLDRCDVHVSLSIPSLSSLQLRIAAITDSHQEHKVLECERREEASMIRLLCKGHVVGGVTVRGLAIFPSTIDDDPTFNRVRIEPERLSWSLSSQVIILGSILGIAALLLKRSLGKPPLPKLLARLAQGYAGMFVLSCTLYIPRVCTPGLGSNAVDSEGHRYYFMKLAGLGSHVMLTLGEHALACGAVVAMITLPLLNALRRARATGTPLVVLGLPVSAREASLFLGLLVLLFPVGMWLYPRSLTDIWTLALSSISFVLLYDLLSALQTPEHGVASSNTPGVKPPLIVGGLLIAGVSAVAFLHSAIFFGQPLLIDSRVPLVYAEWLLSGVVAPSLDDLSFNIMRGYILIRDGAWFPIQPPGHLALVMAASAIGLGGISGLIGFVASFSLVLALARTLRLSSIGTYTTLALFISSPLIVLMHAEYMNHISALIYLLLALLGAYKAVDTSSQGTARWMMVFGAGAGAMAVTRPLTALGTLCPIAIWIALHPHLRRIREWSSAIAASLPFVMSYLVYNKVTTGSYLVSGYEASYGTSHNPGFGVDPQGDPFTLGRGLGRMLGQFGSLSSNALIFPLPLFFVALVGYRVPRLRPLLASALGLPLAYLFYWHDGGPYFSPRFLFESIPLWCLTIGGIVSTLVADRWEIITPNQKRGVLAACLSLIVFYAAVSLLFPVRDTLLFYKTAAARTDVS
jgi:hypothetical protein